MRRTRRLVLSLLVAAALVFAGCGDRVSERDGGGARQLVTESFGSRVLHDGSARDGASVLDALRAATTVETAFGGGFVDAMFDLKSDERSKLAWFYYVNGVTPSIGADQQQLRAGDAVWWDYRTWGGLPDIPTVVGSWPQPFVNGYPTAPKQVSADPPLEEALREAGAPVGAGESDWRVRVGSDEELRRRDPAWAAAAKDPAGAGLTVRIDGSRVGVVGADGKTVRDVPDGRAIAAAVRTGAADGGGALLAVAGIDRASAVAAAQRIARDGDVLRGRYAVVFDGAGEPIAAGGRDP